MAINTVYLDADGLVVGNNQLVATGGSITIGKNLSVGGALYSPGLSKYAVSGAYDANNTVTDSAGRIISYLQNGVYTTNVVYSNTAPTLNAPLSWTEIDTISAAGANIVYNYVATYDGGGLITKLTKTYVSGPTGYAG